MQTFRGFLFHRRAKRVALDKAGGERTEEKQRPAARSQHEKNRDHPGEDQKFVPRKYASAQMMNGKMERRY